MEKESVDSADRKKAVQEILVSVPDYIQKVQCDTNKWTPPFKCAVSSCQNMFYFFEESCKYPYKFHNFPREQSLCQIWLKQCDLSEDTDVSQLKVCSDHFSLDDYIRNYKEEFVNPNFKRKLKSDAVPRHKLNGNVNPSNISTNRKLITPEIKDVRDNDINNIAHVSEQKNDVLNFSEVKQAVDENDLLSKEYYSLLKEKQQLRKKIAQYDKRICLKKKELHRVKQILGEDWFLKSNRGEKNVVRKVFSNAQINLLVGKKKVFWSDDDLAKAFTLRHIGSKECYLYLKNTLNMPLPALACVQKWAASYKNNL